MVYISLLNLLNVAERTWMSVVLRSSDVFAAQKLASRRVHGCTLLDSLFSKAFILYGCITASVLSLFFVFFILFLENLRRHLPILIYMNHIPINNPGAACEHKLVARLKGVTL